MTACGAIKLGFIPLTDAGVVIVAAAKGFFAEEGLSVELSREASWATVRDKLAVGALDGAHLLAPMAFASTLGAGSEALPMIAPLALNLNGAAITMSTRLTGVDGADAQGLARLVRRRRAEGASELTLGVVYPYSVHNCLLRSWLAEADIDPDRDVRLMVAAPSRMPELLADGIIEGFCAGEPWSGVAQAAGCGRIAVRASQQLGRAPDKVFGMTQAWAGAHPAALGALLRAMVRASRWIAQPENRAAFVRILADPDHVGTDPEVILLGLSDIVFHLGGAGAPEPAHGLWMLEQMVRWGQIARPADADGLVERVFRRDLHRAAFAGLDA